MGIVDLSIYHATARPDYHANRDDTRKLQQSRFNADFSSIEKISEIARAR